LALGVSEATALPVASLFEYPVLRLQGIDDNDLLAIGPVSKIICRNATSDVTEPIREVYPEFSIE
jgi:hypothetical protein